MDSMWVGNDRSAHQLLSVMLPGEQDKVPEVNSFVETAQGTECGLRQRLAAEPLGQAG